MAVTDNDAATISVTPTALVAKKLQSSLADYDDLHGASVVIAKRLRSEADAMRAWAVRWD